MKEKRVVRCGGYALKQKLHVYRAEHCSVHQTRMDRVHSQIRCSNVFFWNAIRTRTFVALCGKKILPVEVVRHIVEHVV